MHTKIYNRQAAAALVLSHEVFRSVYHPTMLCLFSHAANWGSFSFWLYQTHCNRYTSKPWRYEML